MLTRQTLLAALFAVCLVQGAFLAPVVANLKGANRRATRTLALLLLSFLPMIGEELLKAAGLIERVPHAIGSSIAIDYLMAPVLFFYARNLIEPGRPFVRRDLLHLIPFVVAMVVLLPFYGLSGAEKIAATRDGLPTSWMIVIAGKIVIATTYLTLVIRRLRAFMHESDDARARDLNVVWFYRSMVGLAGVAVISVVLGLLPSAGIRAPIDSDTIGTLFICGSIYLVSFLLIRHPLATMAAQGAALTELIDPARIRRKYATSPLSEAQKQQHLDRLVRHMDEAKPYLDMSLDLETLAGAVGMRPSHLSQVLNERLEMKFYEFVSSYRVREARARIDDPAATGKTLIAIAHESGFNSKASFNRAFKRLTGQTPSDYARGRTRSSETTDDGPDR